LSAAIGAGVRDVFGWNPEGCVMVDMAFEETVTANNLAAVRLYASFGYRVVDYRMLKTVRWVGFLPGEKRFL
jgi:hypothetical protein